MPKQPPAYSPLSSAEIRVMELVATGLTNKEIARKLNLAPDTIKVHLRNIFPKLSVTNRVAAVLAWQEIQKHGNP